MTDKRHPATTTNTPNSVEVLVISDLLQDHIQLDFNIYMLCTKHWFTDNSYCIT